MTNNSSDEYRVLSIQSHVVSGFVGNKIAPFTLQVLGFEVDYINSVQLCNHTGYPSGHESGQVLNAKDLKTLFDGLVKNDLHKRYTHILTGYVGNESFLETVGQIVSSLKAVNPGALYICDPVMGDDEKLYVPQELVSVYRDKVIPLADVITPNQFEAELLTGIAIKSDSDAIRAVDALHSIGIATVIISSSDLTEDDSQLALIASTRIAHGVTGSHQRVKLLMPKLDITFRGTGDLFSALFLNWFTKTNYDLKTSCEKTVSTIQAILKKTYDYAIRQKGGTDLAKNTEIRLIQSCDELLHPMDNIKASKL